MENPTMLYRAPGAHLLHDVMVDYIIVDAHEVDAQEGWHATPTLAHEAYLATKADPDNSVELSKEEVIEKLTAAGIDFDKRLSAKRLAELLPAP